MSDLIDRQQAIEAICMETCGVSLKTERCMVHCTEVQTVEKLPPAQLGTNLAEVGTDCISRQQAIDVLDVLCQEHRYKIPGKGETYSQYNEAWQDALDRAEGAIFNLPSAQPERIKGHWIDGESQCGIKCSKCGCPVDDFCHSIDYIDLDYAPNFCPNCGSDNREVTT